MGTKVSPDLLQNEWWAELGRATASGGANPTTLSVTITPTKYLKVLILQVNGGTLASVLRFNNDSGANYDYRLQENATADNAQNNQTGISMGSNSLDYMQGELFVTNIATLTKQGQGFFQFVSNTAGNIFINRAGIMYRNASTQISSVQMVATSGSYHDGSELIILGHN